MKTGFYDLDNLINLEGNNLIVIAGSSAMGKSTFALNIANNVSKQGKGVLMFDLEMSKEQIKHRLISQESFIDINKIRNSNFNDEEVKRLKVVEKQLKESKLYINDTPRNYNRTNRRTMY